MRFDAWKAKILNITNRSVNKSSQVSSVEVMKETVREDGNPEDPPLQI